MTTIFDDVTLCTLLEIYRSHLTSTSPHSVTSQKTVFSYSLPCANIKNDKHNDSVKCDGCI